MKYLIFTFATIISLNCKSQTFLRSELTTSLSTPWEITYGQDNYLWLTESGGRVSRIDPTVGTKTVVYTAADYFGGSAMEQSTLCFQPNMEPGAKIIFNGEYETGSSIAFYTNEQILLLKGRVTGMAFGSTYPAAPLIFLEASDVRRLWLGGDRIFFFTEDSKKEKALRSNPAKAGFFLTIPDLNFT